MNYKLNNNQLIINNKSYNIADIDFILLNGKIKFYFCTGEVVSILSGFTEDDKQETYANIKHSLIGNFNHNFIAIKGGKLINLNNVISVDINSSTAYLKTKGFTLQLSNLTEPDIDLLNSVGQQIIV